MRGEGRAFPLHSTGGAAVFLIPTARWQRCSNRALRVYGCVEGGKGPSQKYLEANEVKYFSIGGGGGVGDFMVTISLFQKKLASCLCLPS